MRAFLKSLWGHAADKVAEVFFGIGPFVAILVKNGFSVHRIVEGRYESGAILFTSFSALIVYHALRSAYDVSKEIAERDKRYGFTTSDPAIQFAPAKLGGIVLLIVILVGVGNAALWGAVTSKINRSPSSALADPFIVSVEFARFSVGGKEYGTSLWIRYPARIGCGSMSPIRGMYFLSIKNNRTVPVSVIGYTVDLMGFPLDRVRAGMGRIVGTPNSIDGHFLNPKLNVSNIRPGDTINFGQGPGFSMVQVPLNQSDFSRGINLKMDVIDDLLKKPLPPRVPIRGWAFFRAKNENAFTIAGPGHVTLETDDSKTFSYEFNLRNPHPELDNLDRIIGVESFVDLSDCEHP
jgi:hypothetical protein